MRNSACKQAGLFLVLEGIDGSGTTTQAARLCQSLQERDIPAHLTCEPSTGPIGVLLREILSGQHALNSDTPIDSTTLGLLFASDRADHLQREVHTALAAGQVVISDRYTLSSLAYQGSDKDRDWIAQINRRARPPDCTFFLQVDPVVAEKRRQQDNRSQEIFDTLNTQIRVAQGYERAIAEREASECIVRIDGHQDMDKISATILERTLRLCTKSPAH